MGGLWGYRDWANIEIMTLRKVVPTPSSVGDGRAAGVWGEYAYQRASFVGGVRVAVGVGIRFEGLGLGLGCQRLLRFILRVASHATDVDPWEQAESGAL